MNNTEFIYDSNGYYTISSGIDNNKRIIDKMLKDTDALDL